MRERTLQLLSTRLYLPKSWAEDLERCQKAGIPKEEVEYKKRTAIALELLKEAKAMGIRHTAVVGDAELGDKPEFLDNLEVHRERYVMDVNKDFRVGLSRKGPSQRADALTAGLPKSAWQMVRWREGSEGRWGSRTAAMAYATPPWLGGSFTAIRCWRVDGQGQYRIGWLMAERELPDGEGRNKWHWSNFPPSTPLLRLVELAHRRHHIEQFHQEAKTLLGWDQYQGRLWQGFHRNAILVMLAYSFLVRQSIKLPGRPRQAFSPSQGPSSSIPSNHPSPHR